MLRPFTFKREAQWLLALAVLVPLIGLVVGFILPWLGRQGWW
jgi:hypothetical protein